MLTQNRWRLYVSSCLEKGPNARGAGFIFANSHADVLTGLEWIEPYVARIIGSEGSACDTKLAFCIFSSPDEFIPVHAVTPRTFHTSVYVPRPVDDNI